MDAEPDIFAIRVRTFLAYSSLHFSGGTRITVLLLIRNSHKLRSSFLPLNAILSLLLAYKVDFICINTDVRLAFVYIVLLGTEDVDLFTLLQVIFQC